MTRSFDVFFDLSLNKRLNKQSRSRWFETPSRSLWRQCNDKASPYNTYASLNLAIIASGNGLSPLQCQPSPEPMITYCPLYPWEQTCLKIEANRVIAIQEALENVVCKMAVIFFPSQCDTAENALMCNHFHDTMCGCIVCELSSSAAQGFHRMSTNKFTVCGLKYMYVYIFADVTFSQWSTMFPFPVDVNLTTCIDIGASVMHFLTWTKWRTFCRRYFQMYFYERKVSYLLIQNSLKSVPQGQ